MGDLMPLNSQNSSFIFKKRKKEKKEQAKKEKKERREKEKREKKIEKKMWISDGIVGMYVTCVLSHVNSFQTWFLGCFYIL